MKQTTITLREEQLEFIRKYHLNLSSIVRERINELKEKYKKLEE